MSSSNTIVQSLDTDVFNESKEYHDLDYSSQFVTLESKDNIFFKVLKSDVSISDLVKTAMDGDKSATKISILGVHSDILQYIVEYMNKKKGDDTIVVSKPLKVTMEESCKVKWEAEFIDKIAVDKHKLRSLILASNYMAINSLLHLACARVALSLKGKSKIKMKEAL